MAVLNEYLRKAMMWLGNFFQKFLFGMLSSPVRL
jgi:hypothetical protein